MTHRPAPVADAHASSLRIAHVLRKCDPAEWGGTETAIQRLCSDLQQQGVESIVFCPALERDGPPNPLVAAGCTLRRFSAFMPVWGISASRKRQCVAVGGNLMSFDLLRSLWLEPDISVIHTHALGRLGGIARTIARRRRLPFVVTVHGGVLDLPEVLKQDFATPHPRGVEWGKIFGWLLRSRRLFADADAILTCNPTEATLLRTEHPSKQIVVQQHGVPVESYRIDRREAARVAYPQVRGREVLLCVGRIDGVKNQGWLIDQAPSILRRHPNVLFVLAGPCTDAAYGEALIRSIARLGIPERILLTGGLPPNDPRLIGLFQEARVVVLPSISETFGLVIVEAWAAGTAVIASRTSGAVALVQHGQNGWLFDLNNPEGFHSAVDQALSRPALAAQLAAAGHRRARAEFDSAALAGRMKDLYSQLIEEKHALRHSARR